MTSIYRKWLRGLETPLAAVAGGALFSILHVPLPWMLGPVAALVLWQSRTGREAVWPEALSQLGTVLIAYVMGRTFSAQTLRDIGAQLPIMFAATALTVGFSIAAGLLLARGAGIHPYSGVIGSIPGGLTQMVLLSGELREANVAEVAFIQTVRLIAVVFLVPFVVLHGWIGLPVDVPAAAAPASAAAHHGFDAIGVWPYVALLAAALLASGWIAQKLRLPTPYFMGPLIASAAFAISGFPMPAVPKLPMVLAQAMIGIYIGTRIKPGQLAGWRRLGPYTLAAAVGLIAFSLGTAWLVAAATGETLLSAFLSTAPGGMTEMGVTATAVHANLPLITAFQMFRLFFILFAIPPLLRWGLPRWAANVPQR